MLKKLLKFISDLWNGKVGLPFQYIKTKNINSKSKISYVIKFISDFSGYCLNAERRYHLPAEVLLAQIAGETGWGRKILCEDEKDSKNLFNIKINSEWAGDYVNKKVLEYINGEKKYIYQKFKKYETYQDSVDDYCHLILKYTRYKECQEWNGDIDKYINGLLKGGYATDPQYGVKLKKIIDNYFIIEYEV